MRILGTAAFCLVLPLMSCRTAEPLATASGKAEATIKAPVTAIKAQIISRAVDRKFNVTKDTEYLLQVEKPTENMAAAVLLGSKYDAIPAERIVFTFAPLGDGVRVAAALMLVTNPGSAFEQLTPVNAGEGVNQTQNSLDEIKQSLEAPVAPTASAKPKKKQV